MIFLSDFHQVGESNLELAGEEFAASDSEADLSAATISDTKAPALVAAGVAE